MPDEDVRTSLNGLNHLQDMVAFIKEAILGERSSRSHSFEMACSDLLDLVRLGRPRIIELQKVLGPLDPLDMCLEHCPLGGVVFGVQEPQILDQRRKFGGRILREVRWDSFGPPAKTFISFSMGDNRVRGLQLEKILEMFQAQTSFSLF